MTSLRRERRGRVQGVFNCDESTDFEFGPVKTFNNTDQLDFLIKASAAVVGWYFFNELKFHAGNSA